MTRTILRWQRVGMPRVYVMFGAKMRKDREWRSSTLEVRRIKINRLSYLKIMGGTLKISILV